MQQSMPKATMDTILESTTVESMSESELEDADEGREIKSGCSELRVAIGILHSMRGLPKNISVGYRRPPYIISAPEIRGMRYRRPPYIVWAPEIRAPDTGTRYGRG